MFCFKKFHVGKDRVLAVCDKEIIGKTLSSGQLEIKISESFYGNESIEDEEAVLNMLESCTIANLMGNRIVELAERHGFITMENIISIGGTLHAQIVKV